MHKTPRVITRLAMFASLIVLMSLLGGCAARTVRKPIINRMGVHVDLVREVKGFTTQPRGYEHPTAISAARLMHILNAIEIETRRKGDGDFRQPAFHPQIVKKTAEAISEALAEAGPDQEVGFKIIRKQLQFGLLQKKYLTSFFVYVKDGYLYLHLNRVEWFLTPKFEGKKLPEPRRGSNPMGFRVVGGEHLFYAGPETLEIDWRNRVFENEYRLPGSTKGEKRRREVLDRSPIPKEELDAAMASQGEISISDLSPEQLRALADLEEDRREGRITETAYQRAKRQLLRPR